MTTLNPEIVPAQSTTVDWGEIGNRLTAAFPQYPAADIFAELVQARDAATYVGTADADLAEVVEFMATYALKVRAGLVTPSSRLDPETHASPRKNIEE